MSGLSLVRARPQPPHVAGVVGAPVYINPSYVVAIRPDPADPDEISIVELRDGNPFV
jgi:hypothetical protein